MDWSQVTVKDVLEWASEIPDKRFNELFRGLQIEATYRERTKKDRLNFWGFEDRLDEEGKTLFKEMGGTE